MNYFLMALVLFIISFFLFYLIIKKNIFLIIFEKKKSDLNMHEYPIVQNAGIIIITLIITNILINFFLDTEVKKIFFDFSQRFYLFIISIIILTITSLIDFKIKLHPAFRLAIQFIVTFASLSLIKFPLVDPNIIPLKAQFALVIIFWIYIINVTNFIDGIDGMMGLNVLGFLICILVYLFFSNSYKNHIFFISITILPILLTFLIFNWPKAKLFISDCGAIPIGYIVGYLLIYLFSINQYFIFLISFLYPILDVTLTLFKKTLIKQTVPWARLFDYAFLQPILRGKKKHFFVLKFILMLILLNITFIILNAKYYVNNIILLSIIIITNFLIFNYFNKFRKLKRIN
jgi:UDP-N-acetylmuramyl pentapeptide phosphotransferase/UDP-N-acetylglucosamine-1-phosphate transferase